MIVKVENLVYDFLVEKLKDKNIKVYHGLLPKIKHEDKEEGKSEKDLFPFAILRVTKFEQTRKGIDNYDVPIDFEIWLGSKMDDDNDYLANLSIGDYLKKEFLNESTVDGKFAVDQSFPFSIEYFSAEAEPYFYSVCRFRVFGIAEESEILKKKISALIGRKE